MMPEQTLKVLIVEDRENVQSIISSVLQMLSEQFPKLKIQTVTRLDEALAIIRGEGCPDLVTLDLALDDSTPENTMLYVREIEDRCAVVLVTGNKTDGFNEMLAELKVEVIKKGSRWLEDNTFVLAIARALTRGTQRRMQRRLDKMRTLMEELNPPPAHHAST